MIEAALQELGLNENEARIYLALLKLGASKVNDIAGKTNLPRTFVYEVLRGLISKGLVSYSIISGIRNYEAADPSRLKGILKEKEEKLDRILPELKQMKKETKEKPLIEVYEGKEGIKTILEDILKMKPNSMLYAVSSSDIFKYLQYSFPNFVKRRIKLRIHAKVIQEKSPELAGLIKELKQTYAETRYSEVKFPATTFIYQDKVAFLTMKEEYLIGVLIKDKQLAETELKKFEILWKNSIVKP